MASHDENRVCWMLIALPIVSALLMTMPTPAKASFQVSEGPFCGLYSVYGAMREVGVPVRFADLVKPEYCSGADGSSMAELEKAVRDCGAWAVPIGDLSVGQLQKLGLPAVLHVKQSARAKSYDHYVLFLGVEGKYIRILDAKNAPQLVSVGELATVWDGTCLVVSRTRLTEWDVVGTYRLRCLAIGVLMFTAVGAVGYLHKLNSQTRLPLTKFQASVSCARQSTMIMTGAFLIGFVYHLNSDTGLLGAEGQGVSDVERSHLRAVLPNVNIQQLGKLLADGAVLVDARHTVDYKSGHLPNAVSIPVNSSVETRRRLLGSVDRQRTIVIYCQSEGCPYSGSVASDLMDDGFGQLVLYRGGWREWAEHNNKTASTN